MRIFTSTDDFVNRLLGNVKAHNISIMSSGDVYFRPYRVRILSRTAFVTVRTMSTNIIGTHLIFSRLFIVESLEVNFKAIMHYLFLGFISFSFLYTKNYFGGITRKSRESIQAVLSCRVTYT